MALAESAWAAWSDGCVDRWQTVNNLWEEAQGGSHQVESCWATVGLLSRKLSSQLEWQRSPGDRTVRVVYTQAGQPTAALLEDKEAIVDTRLYWITCRDIDEANYLLAIINSEALYAASHALHVQRPIWCARPA